MTNDSFSVSIVDNDPITLNLVEDTPIDVALTQTSAPTAFRLLVDVPQTYTGSANKLVQVRSDELGLEFTDVPTVVDWGEIHGTLSNQTDLQNALNLKVNISDYSSYFNTNLASKTTDNLAEGSTNKYDKTVTFTGGSNITIRGTYPAFTITDNSENPLTFSSPLARNTNTISIIQSSTSTNGYLSSTDWNTFNSKQAALGYTPENIANKDTSTSLGTSDTKYPSQKAVKTYVDQNLTNAVWGHISGTLSNQTDLNNALGGKEPTLAKGNLSESTSTVLTIGNGTNSVIGSGTTIRVKQAGASQSGYLSSGDWSTFNGKQNTITNPVTGTSVANYITYWDGVSSISGSQYHFRDANDDIGIGNITRALGQLHVKGKGTQTKQSSVTETLADYTFTNLAVNIGYGGFNSEAVYVTIWGAKTAGDSTTFFSLNGGTNNISDGSGEPFNVDVNWTGDGSQTYAVIQVTSNAGTFWTTTTNQSIFNIDGFFSGWTDGNVSPFVNSPASPYTYTGTVTYSNPSFIVEDKALIGLTVPIDTTSVLEVQGQSYFNGVNLFGSNDIATYASDGNWKQNFYANNGLSARFVSDQGYGMFYAVKSDNSRGIILGYGGGNSVDEDNVFIQAGSPSASKLKLINGLGGTTLGIQGGLAEFAGVNSSAIVNVNFNSVAGPATLTGTGVRVQGADNGAARVAISSFGTAGINAFAARHARGTASSPSAVQNGDRLFSAEGWGYGTTNYSSAPSAAIRGRASETWTDSAQGAYLSLLTTANTTLIPTERMNIAHDGTIKLNKYTTNGFVTFTGSNGTLGVDTTAYNSGTGTLNYVTKYSGTNTQGISTIFDDGTLIGFNTNTDTAGTFHSRFRFAQTATDVATYQYINALGLDYTMTPATDRTNNQIFGFQVNLGMNGSKNWGATWGQRFDVTTTHAGATADTTTAAMVGGQWIRVNLLGNDNTWTTDVIGQQIEINQNDARAKITTAKTLYVKGITSAGNLTNRYAIYQDGSSDPNYFAGATTIGSAAIGGDSRFLVYSGPTANNKVGALFSSKMGTPGTDSQNLTNVLNQFIATPTVNIYSANIKAVQNSVGITGNFNLGSGGGGGLIGNYTNPYIQGNGSSTGSSYYSRAGFEGGSTGVWSEFDHFIAVAPYGNTVGGDTFTNIYGFRVVAQKTDGSVTNAFGFYQEGALDKNYFNGYSGFGTNAPTSNLHVAGSLTRKTAVVAVDTTLDATMYRVIVSAVATITLPTAVSVAGREYNIIRSGTSAVTIITTSSQTISGDANLVLNNQWDSVVVVSDGTNWVRCS